MDTFLKRLLLICFIIALIGTYAINSNIVPDQSAEDSSKEMNEDRKIAADQNWIIKWKEQADPAFAAISEVVEELPNFNTVVARPAKESEAETWVQQWRESTYVEYIQPNHEVQIGAAPNDVSYSAQRHLKQIGAEAAWDIRSENRAITIAIVDTGVDLNHVDLKDNLVSGANLIDSTKPPQDDNGHGTGVAGVLAASGNNSIGISGVLWGARIMPIKALDENGTGDESKLGEGIRYAVDNGAKIVVLALGLYKYSPFMKDVAEYAEARNVLLVAASGNDGQAVKYPAAYPTVLAVGGVNGNNQVMSESNFGPEIDVVAPWHVYTTALGGEYTEIGGTSMAAPQVAGVAALILAQNPQLKPYQVRSLISQTAQNIGPAGWDNRSGYGLVRADRALNEAFREDIYENNNTRSQAKPLPVHSMISATLDVETDQDWFTITPPYKGQVRLEFKSEQQNASSQIELIHYTSNNSQGTVYKDLSKPITLSVAKEQSHIQVKFADGKFNNKLYYKIVSQFEIYRDAFEDNDRQYKAYALPAREQKLTGTFHQLNDEDWFVLSVPQSGSLQVIASTDTYRMDLELFIQRNGEKGRTISMGSEGKTEYSPIMDVLPGKYYIRVRDIISGDAYPVAGEYQLSINYKKKLVDPNEPNDRAFQSTTMALNTDYQGLLATGEDVDWFSFRSDGNQYFTIDLDNIPRDRMMSVTLMDNTQKQLAKVSNTLKNNQVKLNRVLPKGIYYIRLTSDQSFEYQLYGLKVSASKIISGYRDIQGHWAQNDIVKLTERGIVRGYGDYLFSPNKDITRAEAVAMIVKALKLRESQKPNFRDVNNNHWAYNEISIAVQAGIISGYPNGTFRPNQPTNRAEMTVMMANALDLRGTSTRRNQSFKDINENYWAFDILQRMKAEGWIKGYDDNTFRPLETASRAEFVSFISRVVK